MRPIVSSTARSVERMSSGVILSSVMSVKFALNTEEETRWIMSWPTDTGMWTSLFFTLLLLIIATIMNVFASNVDEVGNALSSHGGAASPWRVVRQAGSQGAYVRDQVVQLAELVVEAAVDLFRLLQESFWRCMSSLTYIL